MRYRIWPYAPGVQRLSSLVHNLAGRFAAPRGAGRSAAAILALVLVCLWLAGMQGAGTVSAGGAGAAPAGWEASAPAFSGDGLPPELWHEPVECKPPRQNALAPVSKPCSAEPACSHAPVAPWAASRASPPPVLPAAARRVAAGGRTASRPLPPDPALRLHPGQAPPAA